MRSLHQCRLIHQHACAINTQKFIPARHLNTNQTSHPKYIRHVTLAEYITVDKRCLFGRLCVCVFWEVYVCAYLWSSVNQLDDWPLSSRDLPGPASAGVTDESHHAQLFLYGF